MSPAPRLLPGLALGALLVTMAACGADISSGTAGSSSGSSSRSTPSGEITVFAAASLTKTFTQIGAEFEKAHPGTKVRFNFAGSSDLVAQLQQGAPADVFASADTRNMEKATADALTAGAPVVFASNTLQIAVPAGNPAGVTSLQVLAQRGVKVVPYSLEKQWN